MTDHNAASDLNNQTAFSKCAYGDREKLAERFTQYLDHRNTEKGAYVANLNGAWGTGKTFFVDNWCQQLQEDKRLAIKIDAWKSDYLKDPLAIIVAELLEQLKEQSKLKDYSSFERKIGHIFTHLAKSTLATAVTGAGQFFLGEDNFKTYKTVLQESALAATNISNYKKRPEDERLGEFGIEVFKTHNKHKAFVIEFKKVFQNLLIEANRSLSSETINDKDAEKIKTYIFIDELDRCRPTYAIEMLETVKHLFNIPNLVFVLSTDTAQLEHSIKAVYGEGFDAREYLSRFFEQRLLLPTPDHFTFLKSKNSFENLGLVPGNTQLFPAIDSKEKVRAVLAMFCEASNISLRRTLQLADKLEMVLLSFLNNEADIREQVNLFELVACLITREFYYDHAERHIWLSTYKAIPKEGSITHKSDPRILNESDLFDKLLPLKKIEKNISKKTNLVIINSIIEWSEKIRSGGTPAHSNTPFKETLLGKDCRSGIDDYNAIFNKSFDDFLDRNSHKGIAKITFLDKPSIDKLVTLTTSYIESINDPDSTPVAIFGAKRR